MALTPDRQRGRGDGYDLSQQLQVFTSDYVSVLFCFDASCVCLCGKCWMFIVFVCLLRFFFSTLIASVTSRDTCTYLYICLYHSFEFSWFIQASFASLHGEEKFLCFHMFSLNQKEPSDILFLDAFWQLV